MDNNSKTMLKIYWGTMGIILLAIASVVAFVDPFFVYHKPVKGLKEIQTIHQYQVPGVLRNFDYEGVLLGSSVVMGMNTTQLAEKYDCNKVVKAVANSAPAVTLKYFLDLTFDSQDVKYIFYGLDVFSFHYEEDTLAMPDEVKHLNNKNPIDDVKYLWNGDVLGSKIPEMVFKSRTPYDPGMAYSFNQWKPNGAEYVLAQYNSEKAQSQEMKAADYQFDIAKKGIDLLNEKVKQNPETTFVFFTPCYSVVWWDRAYDTGMYESYLHTLDYALSVLLENENVEIYAVNFNNSEYITDLNKFTDVVHGSTEITNMMLEELGNEEQKITKGNYKEQLELLKNIVEKFREKVENEGIDFVYDGAMS